MSRIIIGVLFSVWQCHITLFSQPQISQIPPIGGRTFILGNLQAPQPYKDPETYQVKYKNEPYWGRPFWEFGDGHYAFSDSRTVAHPYEKSGIYQVSTSIIPNYSLSKPERVQHMLQVRGTGRPVQKDYGHTHEAQWVKIVANTQYAVPEYDFRMVVHCQTPDYALSQAGILVLAFNKAKEVGRLEKPLRFLSETYYPLTQYERIPGAALESEISELLGPRGFKDYVNQTEDFSTLIGFRLTGLRGGEEQRFFCSLKAKAELKLHLEKKRSVSVKAIWLPDKAGFHPGSQSDVLRLLVNDVHDPNRMSINPAQVYHEKQFPKTFTYQISFENDGAHPAEDVRLELDWDPALDTATWVPLTRDPNKFQCPECPPDFQPHLNNQTTCFRKDLSQAYTLGKVEFYFHKIYLLGEGESRRLARGYLRFKVQNFPGRITRREMQTKIHFLGGKAMETNTVAIQWRQKSLGLMAGMSVICPFDPDSAERLSVQDRIVAGVYYQNVAKGAGWGWRADAAYASHPYCGIGETGIDPRNYAPDGGILRTRESLRLRAAEFSGQALYSPTHWLIFGAGGGVSLPLSGEANLSAKVFANSASGTLSETPVRSDQATAKLGLFAKPSPVSLFGEAIEIRKPIGIMGTYTLEVGPNNTFALGLRHQFRYYPQFYDGRSEFYHKVQLYLRISLLTLSGKSIYYPTL